MLSEAVVNEYLNVFLVGTRCLTCDKGERIRG